jgi:hypothetical protein
MLNSGNNDREQNWLLSSPRVKRAESDWRATVTLGCPRWYSCIFVVSRMFAKDFILRTFWWIYFVRIPTFCPVFREPEPEPLEVKEETVEVHAEPALKSESPHKKEGRTTFKQTPSIFSYVVLVFINSLHTLGRLQDTALVSSCTGTDLRRSFPESILRIAINHGNVTMDLPKHSQIPISHRALNHNGRHQLIIEISTAQSMSKPRNHSNLNKNCSKKITNFSSLSPISECVMAPLPGGSRGEFGEKFGADQRRLAYVKS